ncbi:MAG: cytochrome oxidase [Planctomycetes bacterium]|nr:cytochrome oxidase [Planctomycetota bacterium]
MNVVLLLLVCSLLLVAGSIVLFVFSARQGDCHEAERICLMPLDDDEGEQPTSAPGERATHLSEENHP